MKIINKQSIRRREKSFIGAKLRTTPEARFPDDSERLPWRSRIFSTVLYLVRLKNIKQLSFCFQNKQKNPPKRKISSTDQHLHSDSAWPWHLEREFSHGRRMSTGGPGSGHLILCQVCIQICWRQLSKELGIRSSLKYVGKEDSTWEEMQERRVFQQSQGSPSSGRKKLSQMGPSDQNKEKKGQLWS